MSQWIGRACLAMKRGRLGRKECRPCGMITATRGGDGADRVTAVECARRPALARIASAPAGAGGWVSSTAARRL